MPLYIEVLCKDREKLMSFLESKNIQCKSFYPNLNRAAYLNLNTNDVFPHSDVFEKEGLTLPCGPDQPLENIEITIENIKLYEQQYS